MGGTLVRTLWNGEQRQAGTHSLTDIWDGKDDAGNLVADGNYQIKVLSNNVAYEWEGVVGNSSSAKSGSTVHHSSEGMVYGMVLNGSHAYYTNGYHERNPTYFKFDINAPQERLYVDSEPGAIAKHVATDGTNMYWAAGTNTECYIFATRASDDTYVTFANGVSKATFLGKTYNSVIGVTALSTPSGLAGLAVQKNGNYLFLSDNDHNQIKVLHKTSGALVQTLSYTNPGKLAIDGSDNLWMITGTSCKRYTVNSNGTLSSPTLTLSSLVAPLAVAVAPGRNVAVADGGTSQQIKIYNGSGTLISTLGQAGGYANGPDVTTDKLYFANTKRPVGGQYNAGEMAPFTFITYAPDGSFWVGDTGNNRINHYSSGNGFIETIMNIGYLYNSFADANNPTRVFANYLEFQIDYSKPLLPNNGSWKLAKNWAYKVVAPTHDDLFVRLSYTTTLSNNRTYSFMRRNDGRYEIVELTANGIRYTGVTSSNLLCALQKNGDIYYLADTGLGQQTTWKKQVLTGFNGSGNPQYGSITTVETVPAITSKDPISEEIYNGLVTSSGSIVTFSTDNFSTGVRGNGYHVGLVKNNQWVARFSPATKTAYEGAFPDNGDYDIGNSAQYTGSHASSIDKSIFWGYNGEFWKGAQTNKWNHFYDNGLFVGQFGITKPETIGDAPAIMAGNAKNFSVVQVGSDYYLYHCDESFHGGVHRWKISNLNSIQEQSISITKSGTPTLPPTDYIDLMANIPATSNGSIASGTGRWTYSPGTYNNAFSNRWEVKAGLTTYKPNDRSLRFASYPAGNGLTRTGQCDLSVTPGATNNLSRWTITGKIGYPETDERDYNYLDVLDNTGRVIVRISRPMLTYPTMAVKVNNEILVQGDFNALNRSVVGRLQPFTITAADNAITVTYAGYAPITTTVFDDAANIASPKTLKVQMYSADNKSHAIDLANFRFYSTVSTVTVTDGTGTGLAAEYFNNKTLTAPVTTVRTDPTVNFDWSYASPIPGTINVDNFSVRWSGQVEAPVSGNYMFATRSDDGVRLWVNGVQIINNWTDHGITTDNSTSIAMSAGQKYSIKLEYYEANEGAAAQLLWTCPGQSQQVIPQSRLYPATIATPTAVVSSGIYLSDLTWALATNGYGPVERDKSNGEIGANDGRTITLNGATYAKGLGIHAGSEITYNLAGRYSTFLSDIGIDDEQTDVMCGSVIFQVYVDNKLDFDSGVMTTTSVTKKINLNIAGKQTLRLVVKTNGEYCGDHGDWAGARVTPAASGRAAFVENSENEALTEVQVYPVPSDDVLWVHYYAKEAGELSLQLVNVTAQPVVRLTQQVIQGKNILKIPVKEFARGIYLLNLTQGSQQLVRRVLLSE